MARALRIHWRAPTFTVLFLISGIIFSIGHHLFYRSLAGTPASNEGYNIYTTVVSKQQLNIAAGTAFAFVVKATLVAAITATYIQLFWREIAHRTKSIPLESIDSIFSALANGFTLFRLWIWYRYPLLFFIAVVCWLLPLAAIATPATLSVKSKPILPPRSSLVQVPTPGFVSLNYVSQMQLLGHSPRSWGGEPIQDSSGVYLYQGPSRSIENVALDVATTGDFLPFTPPDLNSTWELDFAGPALRCSALKGDKREAISVNIGTATGAMGGYLKIVYTFAAWTYTWNMDVDDLENKNVTHLDSMLMLPFVKGKDNSYELNKGYINPGSRMPLQLYLAIPPTDSYWSTAADGAVNSANETNTVPEEPTFIECRLMNATYHIDFQFSNGKQNISMIVEAIDDTPLTGVGAVAGPGYSHSHGFAQSCPRWSDELHEITGKACSFSSILARTLSYQAVFDAFSQLLKGSISWQGETNPVVDSQVLNTILVDSPELRAVRQMHEEDFSTLQRALKKSDSEKLQGFVKRPWDSTGKPLAQAMEKLFQKIVVSSMASTQLQADPKSPYTLPPANVTFLGYQNVYIYSASQLWLAYGIAIATAIVVLSIGMFVIFANSATYSFNFSSIFLFARGASIDEDLKHEDTSAQDPLPAYWAKARVRYGNSKNKLQIYGEERRNSSVGMQEQLIAPTEECKRPASVVTA